MKTYIFIKDWKMESCLNEEFAEKNNRFFKNCDSWYLVDCSVSDTVRYSQTLWSVLFEKFIVDENDQSVSYEELNIIKQWSNDI